MEFKTGFAKQDKELNAQYQNFPVVKGTVFSTPFERGCVATSDVDFSTGGFLALDSEKVECQFGMMMVSEITG